MYGAALLAWSAQLPYLGHIHSSKDGRRLTDAWQALSQQLRRQVVEVQVDVVLIKGNSRHTQP